MTQETTGQRNEILQLQSEITRLRRVMTDLRESEEFSRAVFQSSQTGLVIIHRSTRQIMDANPTAARLLGYELENLVGLLFDKIIIGGCKNSCLLDHPEGQTLNSTAEMVHRNGSHFPVLHSVTHVEENNSGVVLFGFLDITARKLAEDKLRESHQKLRLALSELQEHKDRIVQSEKMASIGQLAAGVAHEINNPIGFVTSNLGTLSEYTETMATLIQLYRKQAALPADSHREREELRGQIDQVHADEDVEFILSDLNNVLKETMEGLVRVSEIVQNLKSFAREDRSGHSRHDINGGIEAMIKVVWNELKYRCRLDLDLGEVPPVLGHGGKINQVVMNMMVNAAHAMPQEGGILTIGTRQVEDNVVITVADNGCGMDETVLSRIFDPFFTTKEVGSGTGLGLSISHGIIQDHGGHIDVDSTPGVGTTFTIILPVGEDPELDDDPETAVNPDDQLIG